MITKFKKPIAIAILVMLFFAMNPLTAAAAGTVTDNLVIKVGYWGIEQENYVEKASYHWTQLDDNVGGALQSHNVAYSFYREGTDNSYGTVIDSARGFYIDDLVEYAGISLRDVQSISFYTADVDVGYFTSFTYSELFGTERYYFNDLSSYLTPIYKDDNKEEMEGVLLDSGAWSDKNVVRPMLALEDSWATYEAGTEHTAPNYNSLSTGNRFRLLFGQTHPQEMKTNQTAKYVHTLYIALNGVPKIKQKKVELSKKIGSHSVTFNVSTGDSAMIEDLIDKLNWNSSDEKVVKIKNIKMQATQQYNDAITVTINYETLKAGEAYITGSYMGLDVKGGTVVMGDGDGTGEGEGEGSEKETSDGKGDTGTDKKKESGSKGENGKKGEKKDKKKENSDLQAYVLNDEVAKLLAEVDESQYEQLEINKKSDDKSQLPFIGIGALALMSVGMSAGYVEFLRKK